MKSPSLQYYCVKKDFQSGMDCRLILSISFEGKRIIFYPGILLKEYEWDRDKKIFINRQDAEIMNDLLQSLKKQVSDIYTSLSIRYGRVTKRHFRDELKKLKIKPGKTLSEVFLKFMEDNHSSWTRNTFLKCKSFYGWLTRFTEYYGSYASTESVNKEFMEELSRYFMRNGLSGNSIYSYFNLFKWFLNRVHDEGLLINTDFREFSLKEIRNKRDHDIEMIALEYEELHKLFLSEYENRKLEYCRDIYCMIAFSGCSLDEIRNLRKQDVDHDFIHIKGRNKRKIPLNKYTAELAARYKHKYFRGGYFFPHYTEMTLNKYIRILSGILKFDRNLRIKRRGKIIEGRLANLITMNSARNTFFANAYGWGLSFEIIKLWSGKKSDKGFNQVFKENRILEDKGISLINQQYEDTR